MQKNINLNLTFTTDMKLLPHSKLNFLLILTFALFSLITLSCRKEKQVEIKDLKFPVYTYYVPKGNEILLSIQSGNQKYSVKAEDQSLIETTVKNTDWPAGSIYVKGVKNGSTQFTVKDEVSGQQALLNIHVVDPFFVMKVTDLIPGVLGSPLSNVKLVREKLKAEPKYNSDFFSNGEIVVLRRNADQQFLVFRNEEDLEKGVIYKSGNYNLDLTGNSSSKLAFTFDDSNKTIEFLIHPETTSYSILLDFSKNKLAGPAQFNPQNPYPYVYLAKDFTKEFQVTDPDLERVELSQGMSTYPYFLPMKIAEGILK